MRCCRGRLRDSPLLRCVTTGCSRRSQVRDAPCMGTAPAAHSLRPPRSRYSAVAGNAPPSRPGSGCSRRCIDGSSAEDGADSARDDLVDHGAPVGWHGVRPLLACGYFALSGRDEVLPEPLYDCALLCRACRGALLYQRQERPRFPRHFCWCRRCGRRYSFGEPHWSPSDSRSGGSNDPRSAPI